MNPCEDLLRERARMRQSVLENLIGSNYREAVKKHHKSLEIDKEIDLLDCKKNEEG